MVYDFGAGGLYELALFAYRWDVLILDHRNPPYGDLHMDVLSDFATEEAF